MTTSINDILYLVGENCSSVHFIELDRLLKKLDHEDLDVIRAMLEESYKSGELNADDRYDEGYEDGFSDGLSTEQ